MTRLDMQATQLLSKKAILDKSAPENNSIKICENTGCQTKFSLKPKFFV
jgi:hypothetical protein